MQVKEKSRSYPVNVFEKTSLEQLFDYYKSSESPITMRLEDEKHNVLIIKYFQLLEGIGGINSETEDNLHVGFVDIENISFDELKTRLIASQIEFDLSSWYILRSSLGNWHCICLDKHSFGFWIDVLKFIDNERTLQYQRFAVNRNRYVLRATIKGFKGKPEMFKILHRKNKNRKIEQSWGHWYFLNLRYGVKKPRKLDHFIGIKTEKYTTVKK